LASALDDHARNKLGGSSFLAGFFANLKNHSQRQKYSAISKEMGFFYLEMPTIFAAIIVSHDRKSYNLRAQSMLKNHQKSTF
jgi:hypothetical protein